MQIDQNLRRLVNRVRRRFIGVVDDVPMVEIEGAPKPPPPPRYAPWRRQFFRAGRAAAAFLITLAILIALFWAIVAARGGVSADWSPSRAAASAGGGRGVAVAAALLDKGAEQLNDAAHGLWLLPTRTPDHLIAFDRGAASATAAFVEVIERRRRGKEPDLAEARALLVEGAPPPSADVLAQRFVSARDALRRFDQLPARRQAKLTPDSAMVAAMARALAAGCRARADALRAQAERGKLAAIDPGAEEVFYAARGQAYGWRLLFAAFRQDAPRLTGPMAANAYGIDVYLRKAAEMQPVFLFNPPPNSRLLPPHLAKLAADLETAAVLAGNLAELAAAKAS